MLPDSGALDPATPGRETTVDPIDDVEARRSDARLTVEEKLAFVARIQEANERVKVPGVKQTPGWVLIREDRDLDH